MKNVILALVILGSWNTFAQQRSALNLEDELLARQQMANEKRAKTLGNYEVLENLKAQIIAKLGVRVVSDQSNVSLNYALIQLNILFKADNNDICTGSASKFNPGFDRTVSVFVQCFDVEGNKTKEISWDDRK
jgi:hypothetical protein